MGTISIELPGDILIATGQSKEESVRDAKLLLAMKLCGLDRAGFRLEVGRMGVPVADLDDEDMDREFEGG